MPFDVDNKVDEIASPAPFPSPPLLPTPFARLWSAPCIRFTGPELADLVAAADLTYDWAGVWLRPQDSSLSSTWLERQLLEAALESGLPLASIRVLAAAAGQGSGAGEPDR